MSNGCVFSFMGVCDLCGGPDRCSGYINISTEEGRRIGGEFSKEAAQAMTEVRARYKEKYFGVKGGVADERNHDRPKQHD